MGILGFLIGMVILVVIRGLQSLQPLMDPQMGIILGTVFAAVFFVYGMGAFDPRMNQHAHEPEEGDEDHALAVAEHEEAEEEAPPGELLGGYMWQFSTLLVVLLIGILFFALLPGGPGIQTVHEPLSNVSDFGVLNLQIGDQTYHFSQLTLLIGFVIFMFVSLAAAAGGLSLVLFGLHQGAVRVKEIAHTPLEAEPMEHVPTTAPGLSRWAIVAAVATLGFTVADTLFGRPITDEFATFSFFLAAGVAFTWAFLLVGAVIRFVAAQTQWLWLVRAIIIVGAAHVIVGAIGFVLVWLVLSGLSVTTLVIINLGGLLLLLVPMRQPVGVMFAILSAILIPLFYFVLIGLIVPFAPPLLYIISASNALVVAALILRPKFLTQWVGYGAGWTAKQLRRLPNVLQ
jgi:hypothetical protein